jgi:hypothetical protein
MLTSVILKCVCKYEMIDKAMDVDDREGERELRNRRLQYIDLRTVDVNRNCAMER